MEGNEGVPADSQHQGPRHVAEVVLDIPAPAEHPDKLPDEFSHMSDPSQHDMEEKNYPVETN